MDLRIPRTGQKRLIIIGGGFAGIELAITLKRSDFQVILIDKHNYHTFQPLLYQVATGGLEPGSIAYPLRRALRKVPNAIFRMAEVKSVNVEDKTLDTSIGTIDYDYLVLATGSITNFFNFGKEVSDKMMPLKSMVNALDLRSFILQNFEEALLTQNESKKQQLINIAIVGGGPTGVELAGALGEMKNTILPRDYPELDFRKMQVHLFEAQSELLSNMSDKSSEKSLRYVKKLGVNVWLNTLVTDYKDGLVHLNNGKAIPTDTIVWTAGVKGNSIEGLPIESHNRSNRVLVDEYNQVLNLEGIYAIGDIAVMKTDAYPSGHPQVAPVAMQQAELLGKNLIRAYNGKEKKPFKYVDKGSMATVGRNKAVVDLKNIKFHGFFAWFVWMFVHMMSLIGFRNKLIVVVGWIYNYLSYDRTLRLIIRPYKKY